LLNSLLLGIASGHVVSSRGKRNPHGVKRKMSNFNLRKRGQALNQPCLTLSWRTIFPFSETPLKRNGLKKAKSPAHGGAFCFLTAPG
jgi:hypothetical protein